MHSEFTAEQKWNLMKTRAEIGDRLRAERMRSNLTQGELAEVAGISKTSQANYEAGMRSPDADYLMAVAASGIDIQFVVTGARASTQAADDVLVVPRLDQVNGLQREDRLHGVPVSRAWVSARRLSVRSLQAFEVKGNSMQGVLSDGDLVLLDHTDTSPRSGFVYVIRQGDELLVKYCQVLPDGTLRVTSENGNFGAYDVDLTKSPNVEVVGRVVASLHHW